jgi:hypothetical protein
MKRRSLSLYFVGLFVVSIVVIEIGWRLISTEKSENPRYLAASKDFPELQQLLKDKYIGGLKYYDYHYFALAPFSSKTVTITDYFSSRRTPASVERSEARTIVWAFGGSTMQNFETSDEFTIANTIAQRFAHAGLKPRVENFGVGSFQSSLEFVKFGRLLAAIPEKHHPKIAVFYDGFNDIGSAFAFGAGTLQKDLALKLAALVESRSGIVTLYGASQWLAQRLRSWKPVHEQLQKVLFREPAHDRPASPVENAVDTYVMNVELTSAICRDRKIACFFVLQPLLVTKTPLTEPETIILREVGADLTSYARAFYRLALKRMRERGDFIDASGCLDGRDRHDFYDFGHTSALTSPVIGEYIAGAILARYRSN